MFCRIDRCDGLVEEVLNHLPDDIWSSPATTFLDPAMGSGQFVWSIEQRLKKAGHSDENIKGRVFGFEKNKGYVQLAINMNCLVGNYEVQSYYDFFDWNPDMKFDVVVGNPPYNSTDTSRDTSNHRGQGDNLAKKFTLKSLSLAKKHCLLVLPYGHRTFSPGLRTVYIENGLRSITSCANHFKQVATNPCLFVFDKNYIGPVANCYEDHGLQVPAHNIGKIFKNQPGKRNRIDYEDQLNDSGKYCIIVTTNQIRFTDDLSLVESFNDKTKGLWRVVFNCTTAAGEIGKIIIADPSATLSKSVHCLILPDYDAAAKMQRYLQSDSVREIIAKTKNVNACNSKKFLQYVPMPK